jgi:ABC-type antimicrobial peptide transport system permease subunit
MIGLALITFVAVLGQGVKTSFVDAVDKQFVADYALTSDGSPLTDQVARAAAAVHGVTAVSEIRTGRGEVYGQAVNVNGVDARLTDVIDMDWFRGSDAVPAALGLDGAIVKEGFAKSNDLRPGSVLLLTTPTGKDLGLQVEGIFSEPKGGSPFGEVGISTAAYDAAFSSRDDEFTFVNVEGGATTANTARLETALAGFPNADVQTRDEFKDTQVNELETVLNIVYALLGLSVIVSLFGIINTLVLSVFERTRELGMLRAIGMTRRQMRRMIRHESIVTALIGAVFGIGVGLFLAALVTSALSDEGVVFAVPYVSLLAFVVAAIVAGILAAILPARRASRLDVLDALQYE